MKILKTVPFDPADHLDDDAAIAAYLSEAQAAGDTDHYQEALGTVARARTIASASAGHGPALLP